MSGDGFRCGTIAITGRPNTGKSSLLNRLLGMDRAIVDDSPGTTRDVVEGDMELAGLRLSIADTAGIRAGADAGGHEIHARAQMFAHIADFFRREDEAVNTDLFGLVCAARDKIFHAEAVTRLFEIIIIIRGHHGDGENLQTACALAFDGGFHRLREGMHGQIGHAHLGDLHRGFFNRVRNVVQFEIQKYFLARLREFARKVEAARINKFHADFIKYHCVAKFFDEMNRRFAPENVRYDVVDSFGKLMEVVK